MSITCSPSSLGPVPDARPDPRARRALPTAWTRTMTGAGHRAAAGLLPARRRPRRSPAGPPGPHRPRPAGRGRARGPVLASREQALAWARAERTSCWPAWTRSPRPASTPGHRADRGPGGPAALRRPVDEAITRTPTPCRPPGSSATGPGRPARSPTWGTYAAGRRLPRRGRDLQEALGIYQDLGDRLGQADALTILGPCGG